MSGADAARSHAPAVAEAFARLQASRPVGLEALLGEPAVLDLHDRFVADVTTIDGPAREAFLEATGDRAAAVMAVVYADDLIPRVITVLDEIYGPGVWMGYPDHDVDDLSDPLAALAEAIDALTLLDDDLVEAVGIRVAQLLGQPVPVSASLDPAAVETHHASDLPASVKAGLALTDAYVRAPFEIPTALVGLVELALTEAQTVGVVLAVTRLTSVKQGLALG